MATTKARTLADFRSVHDRNVVIPNKIRAALVAMEKQSAEHWEYEADFMKLAGISQTDIGQFREQFTDHIVTTSNVDRRAGRRVWFATVKAAKAARG